MRKLFFAFVAVSLLTVACKNETEPVAAQPDFTGKWEGHMTYSDEQIDAIHEMYPEGDRDELERSLRRDQEAIAFELELNSDGTMSFGVLGGRPDAMNQGTWNLSGDGETITISMMTGEISDGSWTVDPVTGEKTHVTEETEPGHSEPIMSLKVAKDGQSLIATDSTPEAGRMTFTRPRTVAMEKPVPDDPYSYAESGEVADFVGEWGLWFEMEANWDDMRGRFSEAEVQQMKEDDDSVTGGAMLFDDMTWLWTLDDDAPDGTWALSEDGATVFLEMSISEEAAAVMEAADFDNLTLELRLTEDRTTLVGQGSTGFVNPASIFKRK